MDKRIKHGMSKSLEYKSWADMRQRCTNPNRWDYDRYGGRGITCDPSWDTFVVFYKDMGNKPSPKHSLERIDNNRGYCKENCMWADKPRQGRNQRTSSLNTTGCKGVTWNKQHKKYMVRISVDKKRKLIGLFKTLEEAIKARKQAEEMYW